MTARGQISAGRRRKAGAIFAHSRLDALMLAATATQLALIVWGLANFPRLSLLELTFFFIAHVLLSVLHYDVVVHNFVHTPFFSSKLLNSLYGAIGSIIIVEPCTLMGIAHMAHHRYGNDAKNPLTGTTRDATSTYQFGADGSHEPLWGYALLSPLREWSEIRDSWRTALASRARPQIGIEAAMLIAFWVAIVWIDWRFALFYLFVVYAGQLGACAQNYFEHYGAMPGNRKTDSVSCYHPVYNFLWFNNGYHQEHHYRPGVHWTEVRALRSEMLPENQRRVVKWAHFANLP